MHVRIGCRCATWVQVTIGRRWKPNAGQNWVQVRIGCRCIIWVQVMIGRSDIGVQVRSGRRSELNRGQNWVQASLGADHNWCRSE